MPTADPMMGGAPEDPMADPMTGGAPEDPMADPMAGGAPEDPMAGGETPTDDTENGADDSTMSIINQLSDEDREAVRSYAESMLNKHGGKDSENPESDMEDPMAGGGEEETPEMAPPVPEGKCFTKKQLKEAFGVGRESEEMQRVKNNKLGNVNRHNPFIAPRFK